MEPILTLGAIAMGAAWLKSRNKTAGTAGATPSARDVETPVNPTPSKLAISQTPPVTSEMSLATRSAPTFQNQLYPSGIATQGALSQGSGTDIADDGRIKAPAAQSQIVEICDFGATGSMIAQQQSPTPVSPTTLTPQPAPVSSVTVADSGKVPAPLLIMDR